MPARWVIFECYYSRYSSDDEALLISLADKRGLLASAGSDYHGKNKTGIALGQLGSHWSVDTERLFGIICK